MYWRRKNVNYHEHTPKNLHNLHRDCSLTANNICEEPIESIKKVKIGGKKRIYDCSIKLIQNRHMKL